MSERVGDFYNDTEYDNRQRWPARASAFVRARCAQGCAMTTPYIGTHPAGKALAGFFITALKSRVVALTATAALTIDSDYLRSGATAGFWPRNAIDDYAFASIEAKRIAAKAQGR